MPIINRLIQSGHTSEGNCKGVHPTHSYMYTCTHTHTHVQKHTHSCAHTHVCTYSRNLLLLTDKIEQQKLKLIKLKEDLQKHKGEHRMLLSCTGNLWLKHKPSMSKSHLLATKQCTDAENAMLMKFQKQYNYFFSHSFISCLQTPSSMQCI